MPKYKVSVVENVCYLVEVEAADEEEAAALAEQLIIDSEDRDGLFLASALDRDVTNCEEVPD